MMTYVTVRMAVTNLARFNMPCKYDAQDMLFQRLAIINVVTLALEVFKLF
jgi:hypothetical protein